MNTQDLNIEKLKEIDDIAFSKMLARQREAILIIFSPEKSQWMVLSFCEGYPKPIVLIPTGDRVIKKEVDMTSDIFAPNNRFFIEPRFTGYSFSRVLLGLPMRVDNETHYGNLLFAEGIYAISSGTQPISCKKLYTWARDINQTLEVFSKTI